MARHPDRARETPRAVQARRAPTDEIREELQFHLAMRADEYARHGLDAAAARQAALRRFGNLAVIQDRGYDVGVEA